MKTELNQKVYAQMSVNLNRKEYSKKETVSVMETVLFTKLTEQSIGKSPIGSLNDPKAYIEHEWNLNASRTHDFKVLKRILINSVKKN